MQAQVNAADIVSEILNAVISVNEPDKTKADGTKTMIKQMFISGASMTDLQRGCMAIKHVVDTYAKEIDGFKKTCGCTETEKAAQKQDNMFGF